MAVASASAFANFSRDITITAAYARDSDIYLSVTSGTTTAEPNILVVLDTSDSMNIPEPWREYPGEYDSHVEYLWADLNLISTAEVPAENVNSISTGVPGPALASAKNSAKQIATARVMKKNIPTLISALAMGGFRG
jgi:hypothetical protein